MNKYQAGDDIGKDFGWIGHSDCKSKCPNDCDKKKWQYWKERIDSKKGIWEFDHSLDVEGVCRNFYIVKVFDIIRYIVSKLNYK